MILNVEYFIKKTLNFKFYGDRSNYYIPNT